ncbi:MAG: hypothetical protein Aurels2KO_55950 [Aureliella sp.]
MTESRPDIAASLLGEAGSPPTMQASVEPVELDLNSALEENEPKPHVAPRSTSEASNFHAVRVAAAQELLNREMTVDTLIEEGVFHWCSGESFDEQLADIEMAMHMFSY